MSASRAKVSPEAAAETVATIRAYHAQGVLSLSHQPADGVYGGGETRLEATTLGWNVTKVLKARKFARWYSATELDRLCRGIERHRPTFGLAHIALLVTVPDKVVRKELQRWCVEENVTKAELKAELKLRYGSRRAGGRWKKIGTRPDQLLVQLDEMADSWLRWHQLVGATQGENGSSLLSAFPVSVRRKLDEASRAVQALRDTVDKKLTAMRAAVQ